MIFRASVNESVRTIVPTEECAGWHGAGCSEASGKRAGRLGCGVRSSGYAGFHVPAIDAPEGVQLGIGPERRQAHRLAPFVRHR